MKVHSIWGWVYFDVASVHWCDFSNAFCYCCSLSPNSCEDWHGSCQSWVFHFGDFIMKCGGSKVRQHHDKQKKKITPRKIKHQNKGSVDCSKLHIRRYNLHLALASSSKWQRTKCHIPPSRHWTWSITPYCCNVTQHRHGLFECSRLLWRATCGAISRIKVRV